MNRFLCCSVLLLTLCCTESCSLQRLIKRKKGNIQQPTASDSTVIADSQNVRFAIYPQPDTFVALADTAGEMKKLADIVTPLWNNRLQYKTFTGKAKVHFEGPDDKQDFTAYIRVKKDTSIWINIFGLGGTVNAARAIVTADSFFMINYLQKEVTKLPLSQVAKILPTQVDLVSLQNLIIGEPLRAGGITNVAALANSWLIYVQDSNYLQTANYSKKDSLLEVNQVNTRELNGPQAVLKYQQYEQNGSRKISVSRAISIRNGADVFQIDMDLQNIEFDKVLEMPFNIPRNYTVK